jgi:uncharacterized membrane protein
VDRASLNRRSVKPMRLIWYRLTHWLRHSSAILPLLLATVGLGLAIVGSWTTWPATADRGEILATLGTIAAGAFFLLSTSLTRILGQIAFATGLYSPRLAVRLLNRPIVAWSTGLFIAVLGCAGVSALVVVFREADEVGVLPLGISAVLLAVSFLGFIGVNVNMTRTHRVSNVVGTIARDGLREIDHLYTQALSHGADEARRTPPTGDPDQVVRAIDGAFGVLLGFFSPWLVPVARVHRATIVIVPAVGDFVEPGTPLFHVFGPERIRERTLLAGVRLGEARTVEQDPLFALRLLVDVAVRALSPAVNDPYTAVQSLDRIAQLLAALGDRNLGEGWRADSGGTVRLWYATPDWSDYTLLAFSEIRAFGARIMPVARRLRAVLLDLHAALPPGRRTALEVQLRLLDVAVASCFPGATEREQAMTPDRQGFGASSWREGRSIVAS